MKQYISTKHASLFMVMTLIISAACYVWILAGPNHIISIKDCGETFIAQHQVQNFRLYGFKHLLMEDHATSMDESEHPFLYTHNVNIGSLTFQVLDSLGAKTFAAKQIFTVFLFSLGIFYVFLAINFITKSSSIALLTVLFSITDINQILAFSTNPLRAWHWLALFGLLFHVARFVSNKNGFINKACILFFMTAAFGIGYEFFCICLLVAIASAIILEDNTISINKSKIKKIMFIVFLSCLPFIARQTQVAAVMGLNFWLHDFYYSVVIKIPFVVKVLPLDFDTMNSFYEQYNILRPPANPAGHGRFGSTIDLFFKFIDAILIPEAGLLSIIIFTSILLSSLIRQTNKLLITLISASLAGMYIFAPFSLHVYFKHQFPLIAVPLHFSKAIFISQLFTLIKSSWQNAYLKTFSIIMLIGAVFADHMYVHTSHEHKTSKMDMGWINSVQQDQNSTYAVSWIPSTVAGFTNNWVIGIKPHNERLIANRFINTGKLFTQEDLFLFGQNNASMDKYLNPDYWIYFRMDNSMPFDTNTGTLDQDYLYKFLKNALVRRHRIKAVNPWISTASVYPGSIIAFGGNLKLNSKVKVIELETPYLDIATDQSPVTITHNLKNIYLNLNSKSYRGEYVVPKEYIEILKYHKIKSVNLILPIAIKYNDATSNSIIKHAVRIDIDSPLVDHLERYITPAQLTKEELIEATGNTIPIKELGTDYIIFDLRNIKN